jgi:hypothetical protein
MKKRLTFVAVAMLGIWACGQGEGDAASEAPADTLTRQQRDSVLAEMPIPGIGGIQRARQATDAAAERAAGHDSIG